MTSSRPLDTSPAAWAEYGAVLDRMGPEQRVQAALDMSEAVRLLRLAGIRALYPTWSEAKIVREFIREEHGVDLWDRR